MNALKLGIDISGFDLQRVGIVFSVRDDNARPVSTSSPLNMSLVEFNALIKALDAKKSAVEVSTRQSQSLEPAMPNMMPGLRNANSFGIKEPEETEAAEVDVEAEALEAETTETEAAEVEAADVEAAEMEAAKVEAEEAEAEKAEAAKAEAAKAEAEKAEAEKAAAKNSKAAKAKATKAKATKSKAAKAKTTEAEVTVVEAAVVEAEKAEAAKAEAAKAEAAKAEAEKAEAAKAEAAKAEEAVAAAVEAVAAEAEIDAAVEEDADAEIIEETSAAIEEEDGDAEASEIPGEDSMLELSTHEADEEAVVAAEDTGDSDWEVEDEDDLSEWEVHEDSDYSEWEAHAENDYSEWEVEEDDEDDVAAAPASKQKSTFESDPEMIADYEAVSKARDSKDASDGENVGFFGGLRRSLGFNSGPDAATSETVSKASDADRNVAVRDIVRKHIEGRSWE